MQLYCSRYWFKLLLLVVCILITGCNKNDMPFPRCISADYFGPEPVAVGAHFPSDHVNFLPEGDDSSPIDPDTGEVNYGFHSNQVVRWKDTGFETNGDDLVVRVNGAWTSWGINNKKESNSSYSLENLEQLKYATKFEGGSGDNALPDFHLICNDYKSSNRNISSNPSVSCSVNCKCLNEDESTRRGIPCWFTNGHGAYFLFKRPGDENPNKSLKYMRNPQSPNIHLGYNSIAENGSGLFTLKRDSTELKDGKCVGQKLEKGWKIYVKILDRYYLDNAGGYSFEFLSGVQKPSSFGFFDEVYSFLKCTLLINGNCQGYFESNDPAAAQAMFENIAEKSTDFHNFVRSLLVLYVVISSLLYLFGMVQDTRHDLIVRMMKITLVVALISPGSFKFFYNHFLVLFIKGLEQLVSIITNFAPNSNTDKLFGFIENMFNKFFAYSVWKKFAGLWHYQMWASSLMIPAIFVGIVLYFILCIYAYVIFLSGFVGIAFLIAIMPLFFISILFSQLKDLFQGWIKFCISFCLQSIMVFTLLSLFAALIMSTFYRQLGFTVCYNKWLEIRLCAPSWMFGGFCVINNQYFDWTPGQIFVPYTIGEASPLNVDKSMAGIESLSREGGTVKFTNGAGYILLPPDYVEKGFRYIDYPFFNPVPGTESNPTDHYITESDLVINKDCNVKDLVRLTNSLSHAVEKSDILSLIDNIGKRVNIDSTIKKKIEKYKKDNILSDLKDEIKSLVVKEVERDASCQIQKFHEVNKKYQENSDYKRVQDIKRGYLINAGDIFVLFLLSFLMFSLRKFAQELGLSLARGGYSIGSISQMYDSSPLAGIAEAMKNQYQKSVGGKLESLGNWAMNQPNRIAGGVAHLIGRGVGKYLPVNVNIGGKEVNLVQAALDAPRKLINVAVGATKFMTSPKNDVDKLEEKIYNAFGVDKEDIAHRRINKYLDYYRGYVGSHLGYTLEDAMKFAWNHGVDSIGKRGYKHNLLYRAKTHRKEFLQKLRDYTIGRKRVPERYKDEEDNTQPQSSEEVRNISGDNDEGREVLTRSSPGSPSSQASTSSSGPSSPQAPRRRPKRKAPEPPDRRSLPGDREPDSDDDEV